MFIRFSVVFLTLLLAIIVLFIAAQNPTGPNTISFDEPIGFWISFSMLVALFIPPLVLSFFNHIAVKIISSIYQIFIVLSFIILIPISFIIPSLSLAAIATLGALLSICSIAITIFVGLNRRKLNDHN